MVQRLKNYEFAEEIKAKHQLDFCLLLAGIFFTAYASSANFLATNYDLKLFNFTKKIVSTGIPKNSIEKYIEFFKSENLSFMIYGSKKIINNKQANRDLLFSNFSDKNFIDDEIDKKTEDEILKKYTDLEIKLLSEKYLQKYYSLDIFAKEENIDRNELLIIFRRNKTFLKKQKLIRSIYENAYTKWGNEQKVKLFSLYYSGVDILDLSQTFKRSPTALIVQLFENNSLSEEEYNAHLLQLSKVNIE